VLSRQQKERNICEWLEQLNCNDDQSNRPRMAISPTISNSTNSPFLNQMNSPSSGLAGQKPPQFPSSKTTPMQH
jgi:hypothetical protein